MNVATGSESTKLRNNYQIFMIERKSYPVRTMRLSKALWEDLIIYKTMRRLTWNRLLMRLLESDAQVTRHNKFNNN